MKSFILLWVLVVVLKQQSKKTVQCSLCNELKSQNDCEKTSSILNCKWDNSICIDKPIIVYQKYCEQIEDPDTKCSENFGCAYVESKCTHFTGCTAYVKTTQADCQAISYQCTSNGVTCDDIQECSNYSPQACEQLEDGKCRDFKCSEAPSTLNTDSLCIQWKIGCVTTGMGCADTRLPCNQYVGDSQRCSQMIGQDGKCSLDTGTTCKKREAGTNSKCAARLQSCLFLEINKCISNLADCSEYIGSSTEDCKNFSGYLNVTTRTSCWWESGYKIVYKRFVIMQHK